MITAMNQLEAGMYQDAKAAGMTLTQFLDHEATNGRVDGDLINPDLVNRETGAVDSFRQLMKKAGVKTKGPRASRGEVFFTDTTLRVLFPEFLDRSWRDFTYTNLIELTLEDVIGETIIQDSAQFRGLFLDQTQATTAVRRSRVSEGAELPRHKIVMNERILTIYKFGGIVEMTYETMRRSTLNQISIAIGLIAAEDRRDKVRAALEVALNGDGNSNPAWNIAAAAATLADADFVEFMLQAAVRGQSFRTITGDYTETKNVALLGIPRNSQDMGDNARRFLDEGVLPSPFGFRLRMAPAGSVLEGTKKTLGFGQMGITYHQEAGSVIQETDRLITHQVEQFAFSEVSGMSKPHPTLNGTITRP